MKKEKVQFPGSDDNKRRVDEVELFWFKIAPVILVIGFLVSLAHKYL